MTPLLAAIALGFTVHGERSVTATVTFTGEIVPGAEMKVEDHYLGNNVVAYVTHYDESHMPLGNRHEVVETIAMRGDSIEIETSTRLAVRRYRRDGWPVSDEAVALLARR